ncbi:MAG: ABC transporter ATP-binding protein [Actinomycetota bacterium]
MNALIVDNVTKTYRIGVGRARIREMLPWPLDTAAQRAFPRWWMRDTFNALERISFSVSVGESVGLVGHNGAGKTTLLKVISGVTNATEGSVAVSGSTGALIDVLVGFHPDLTGRENTYLIGAVYGFGRRAMASRLDRILEFAEIDELADTPLKRYSTGMMARLGFGIMASLDMDVLLVDEVLSVGDAAFQRKCIGWLKGFRDSGGTLVFVSHNLALVRSMTDRVIWLDHGKLMSDGPTDELLRRYGRAVESRDTSRPTRMGKARKAMVARGMHRWGAGGAHVERVHVVEPSGGGDNWRIEIDYVSNDVDEAVFCVGFIDESGRELGGAISPLIPLREREGVVSCLIDPLPFRGGIYFPVVAVRSGDGVVRDQWRLDRGMVVDSGDGSSIGDDLGPVSIEAQWANGSNR